MPMIFLVVYRLLTITAYMRQEWEI